MTPHEAIQWLTRRGKHVKFGADNYAEIANVIRSLVRDRANLWKAVDAYGKEEQERLNPKKRVPFETEGNGQWDVDQKET